MERVFLIDSSGNMIGSKVHGPTNKAKVDLMIKQLQDLEEEFKSL